MRAASVGTAAGLVLFPNPAGRFAALSGAVAGAAVQVLDVLGRLVGAATADASGHVVLYLPEGLAGGVYTVRSGPSATRLVVE